MGLTKNSTGAGAKDKFLMSFPDTDIKVALCGNPNVGKSTLFNYITGMHQHTGNWPGKTVTGAVGSCIYNQKSIALIDLPGCYSLLSHSPEEEVARDYIMSGEPDITIVVCDATCLERNLILVLQTLEITNKVIVCVNLIDEAEKKGIKIDVDAIFNQLKVPVITTSARSGNGVNKLLEAVVNEEFKSRDIIKRSPVEIVEFAEKMADEAVILKDVNYFKKDRKIDEFITGKGAYPAMFLLLLGIFWLTISGANGVSAVLSSILFKTEEWLNIGLLHIGVPRFFREMFVFGGYRMLIWVVSVMLPPMAIFFPLFTLLEDFPNLFLGNIIFVRDSFHQAFQGWSLEHQGIEDFF